MNVTEFCTLENANSIMEGILYAIKKISEDDVISDVTVIIDNKYYVMKRGDKLTDILKSWCNIRYEINDDIDLKFKDDDVKFKFYITLLSEHNACFAKFAINLANTLGEYIEKYHDISKRKYYPLESTCLKLSNSTQPLYLIKPKARKLLKECMIYSDKLPNF